MSKTDKTRPWWVQERDPWLRADFREDHDHRNGTCDIERRVTDPWLSWSSTSCHIVYRGTRQVCACRVCTGYWWRKRQRRRLRHETRMMCAVLRKDRAREEDLPYRLVVSETW